MGTASYDTVPFPRLELVLELVLELDFNRSSCNSYLTSVTILNWTQSREVLMLQITGNLKTDTRIHTLLNTLDLDLDDVQLTDGICTRCGDQSDTEPDSLDGHCTRCNTATVVSLFAVVSPL